ncbi:MAG: hypothetical protein HUJ31_01440 [Pseudomonadales bacterium]|nr:hypothetical protein [Pseudomonadales bacterium]
MPGIRELNKVELHCHLDGLLDPEMLRRLAGSGYDIDPTALDAVLPVTTKEDWIDRYIPAHDAILDAFPDLRPAILEEHIRRLIDQNVIYAEIMLSGVFAPPSLEQSMDLVRKYRACADHASRDAIQVEFVCAICRADREVVQRKVEWIIELHKAGLICGFAIACEEDACTIESLADLFDQLHDTGMGIEIHAGEWLGADTVRDAIDWGHPHRIGHGVHGFEDPALIDLLQARDIHLEFCPTSNLKTGAIAHIEDHPINVARQRGMNFSINTDDPGAFSCSMTSEFELLERTFGFTGETFDAVLNNSLRSAFVEPRLQADG